MWPLWLDVSPLLYYKLTYGWVCFERSFEFLKLRKKLPRAPYALGYCPAQRWRTCLRSDVWQAGTVITASRYEMTATLVINKYQTGVMLSTTCLSDWRHWWLNVNCVRRCFVSLIDGYAYSQLLWSPYVIGQTIIFLPCSFFLSSFFSSPNLSGRMLDVYHTLTHGVALVRI